MPEWLIYVLGNVFAAGAVYGGVRGDLKALRFGLEDVKEAANDAHKRIDNLLQRKA